MPIGTLNSTNTSLRKTHHLACRVSIQQPCLTMKQPHRIISRLNHENADPLPASGEAVPTRNKHTPLHHPRLTLPNPTLCHIALKSFAAQPSNLDLWIQSQGSIPVPMPSCWGVCTGLRLSRAGAKRGPLPWRCSMALCRWAR